jgi:hypothetical protein
MAFAPFVFQELIFSSRRYESQHDEYETDDESRLRGYEVEEFHHGSPF